MPLSVGISRTAHCGAQRRVGGLAELATCEKITVSAAPRLFIALRVHGPANVLSLSRHVPSQPRGATQRVAPDEPRKRRAGERHVVGCCEELAGRQQRCGILG